MTKLTGTFDLHSCDPWTREVYYTWFRRTAENSHYIPPVIESFDDPRCWEPGYRGAYAQWCIENRPHFMKTPVFANYDVSKDDELQARIQSWSDLKQTMKAGTEVDPVQFRVEPDGSLFLVDGRHRIAIAWALKRPVAAEYEMTPEAQASYERAIAEGLGRPYQKPLHPMFREIDGWRHDARRFDVIVNDARAVVAGGGQAIDVGASYGRFSWGLHDAGFRVTSVDCCPVDVRFWPSPIPRVRTVFDVSWQDEYPRVLLLLAVMHHMSDLERERCVALANEADVVYVEPTVSENPCLHVDLEPWLSQIRGERECIYTTVDVNGRPVYRWRHA